MKFSRLKVGALAGLSLALAACASGVPVKDATLFPDRPGKDAKDKAPTPMAALTIPTDLEGAVRQAQAQRRNGDFTAAAKTLSQLVLVAPDDARVLGEYAKTLIAEGRSDDALAFLERAISLRPPDWSLYSAQGVAYDQKGDYQAAQAAYGRALALKPGEPTVLSNDALSHMQSGDLDGAEKMLLEAARSGAEFPRIASNLALVRSLKSSTPQPPSVPMATAEAAPEKPAPVVPPPLAVTPIPEPQAVPPAGVAVTSPVTRTVLPAPEVSAPSVEPKPLPSAAAAAAAAPRVLLRSDATAPVIEQLRADPSVRIQAVPKDPMAGPVAPKGGAAKPAVAQPAVEQTAPLNLRRTLANGE